MGYQHQLEGTDPWGKFNEQIPTVSPDTGAPRTQVSSLFSYEKIRKRVLIASCLGLRVWDAKGLIGPERFMGLVVMTTGRLAEHLQTWDSSAHPPLQLATTFQGGEKAGQTNKKQDLGHHPSSPSFAI